MTLELRHAALEPVPSMAALVQQMAPVVVLMLLLVMLRWQRW